MLSRAFLEKIAHEKGLSKLQQDIFVEKFVDARPDQLNSNEFVAESLLISTKSVTNAMSKVYFKFGLEQPGPNKAFKLFGELLIQQNRSSSQENQTLPTTLSSSKTGNSLQRSPILKIKDAESNQLKRKINKLPKIQEALNNKKSELSQKSLTPKQKITIVSQFLRLPEREVNFFFNAEPLSRDIFINLAKFLGQSWIQIADGDFTDVVLNDVPPVRAMIADSIRRQCGTLRTLDVETSIEIDELYVDVNILKNLTARQRKSISDLPAIYNLNKEKFDQSLLEEIEKTRISGDKAALENQKMMIFGKPGSGKTTFLKHIAMMCNQELFQPHRIPIFIQLRTYVDSAREINNFDIKTHIKNKLKSISDIEDELFNKLIHYGRLLILLDGLDEVPDEDARTARLQMKTLFQDWGRNRIIVTCRIAASEHTFENFTEVEVSDFNLKQIEVFSRNWFSSRFDDLHGNNLFFSFMEKICKPENRSIREIAVTPILLILTCLVFQEKGEFPKTRYRLYEEGIDILIEKWDRERDIERHKKGIYKTLNPQERKALLSHIASITFEQSEYFFEREKLWKIINYYFDDKSLENKITPFNIDQQELDHIVNSIEVQHGLLVERARNIYSFSHLTFQEYFTAQKIAINPNSEISKKCINQITDKRFLEVFLLASEMLGKADFLLNEYKKNIDNLLAKDLKCQQFLQYIQQRSKFENIKREPFLLRAFYFDCYMVLWDLQGNFKDTLSATIKNSIVRVFKESNLRRRSVLDSDYALMKLLGIIIKNRLPYKTSNTFFSSLDYYLDRAITLSPEADLQHNLIQLQASVPTEAEFPLWWKDQAIDWTKRFRHILKQYRHLGYDWRFDKQQKQILMEYYNAHIGLIHRLNTDCVMSPTLREDLRNELLLPQLP